jgi:hypothetical protein
MLKPNSNVLSSFESRDERVAIRKLVVSMVLSTDNANHSTLIGIHACVYTLHSICVHIYFVYLGLYIHKAFSTQSYTYVNVHVYINVHVYNHAESFTRMRVSDAMNLNENANDQQVLYYTIL